MRTLGMNVIAPLRPVCPGLRIVRPPCLEMGPLMDMLRHLGFSGSNVLYWTRNPTPDPVFTANHSDATVLVAALKVLHGVGLHFLQLHDLMLALDAVIAQYAEVGATKHRGGEQRSTFCVSLNVNKPLEQHAETAVRLAEALVGEVAKASAPSTALLPTVLETVFSLSGVIFCRPSIRPFAKCRWYAGTVRDAPFSFRLSNELQGLAAGRRTPKTTR